MRRRGFWAAQAEHVLLREPFRVAVARAEGQAFQNVCPWDSALWLRTLVPHQESTPRALQILQQLRPLDVQRHPPLHVAHTTHGNLDSLYDRLMMPSASSHSI